MSSCLLQIFVNKLNNYEPELARRFIIPEVQEHLDRVEQDKQEYILQTKYVDLNLILAGDEPDTYASFPEPLGCTHSDYDVWETQNLRLEDMLDEVNQDMAVMNIIPLYDPYGTNLDEFYERFPSDKYDVWEGDYPPRYFE